MGLNELRKGAALSCQVIERESQRRQQLNRSSPRPHGIQLSGTHSQSLTLPTQRRPLWQADTCSQTLVMARAMPIQRVEVSGMPTLATVS
jgi:hypothetical protein